MENRKPSGRAAGKYGKPQKSDIKSRRTDGKADGRPESSARRQHERQERPSERSFIRRERSDERSERPSRRPLIRKVRPGERSDVRSGRFSSLPAARREGDAERSEVRSSRTSGKLTVKKLKPEDRPKIRAERLGERSVSKPRKRGSRGVPKAKVAEEIRLNRFIANSGACSRRDADEYIKNGLITVNGKLVTDLGTKVTYDDDVRLRNKRLSAEKKVYILMNKPKDYVTTVEDPHAEHTVLELIGDACPERVYPVGRLDKATTGVLLLTNDGELTGKLTHPKYKRKKIYHVYLDHPLIKNDLFKLTEGIELDGEIIAADAVAYADTEDKSQIGIELHSGQNRVIRRIFETIGYKVKKLDRVYFAGLTKKNLKRGKWRFLTDKEVSMLKRGIF
jgi:23S rRNA pseudouridine2605 synthase